MNATLDKFRWPETKIAELEHWAVMLRPEQPTLGALVLVCKQPAQSYAEVDAAGFAELRHAIGGIETMLSRAIGYEKINYLMLMMVDPDVHYHVLPRYEGTKTLDGISIADGGWPGPPVLGGARALTEAEIDRLARTLAADWPS
ncbi:MAG: HIT family protein [Pseudomonadota bacterium]